MSFSGEKVVFIIFNMIYDCLCQRCGIKLRLFTLFEQSIRQKWSGDMLLLSVKQEREILDINHLGNPY